MKRIAIIGNAGSGKSTLATRLSELTKLPVYHLDKYFWQPYWVHPDPNEYAVVHNSLCNKDQWIIDGMQLRLLEYRAERADIIIFLDFPRYICFWRIFKRLWNYYGKQAPYSAEKCTERLGWGFILFLKWVWGFNTKYPAKITRLLHSIKDADKKVYVLKSPAQVEEFIKGFKV